MTYQDPWNTPERRALRETVTAFVKREVVPNLRQWEDDNHIPNDLQKKIAKAGFLGAGWAEEDGGDGGDLIDQCTVVEAWIEAGGSSGSQIACFTHAIAIPHILQFGSQDLKDRYARPALAGDLIGALGITEPGAGSDVANISTRAARDGDDYVLNGAKMFITSAPRGDFVTTAVRTGGPGHGGISLVVVDKGTPGFEVSKKLDKHGWLCSDTGELSFQDARVPAANLVGEEGQGFYYIMQQFITERLVLAAQSYATAQRALDLTIEYAKMRETFGKPLTKHQVIRHKLVEMHRVTQDARTVTHKLVERALTAPKTDKDLIRDAALCKNTAVKAVEFVTNEAVQIHGGMGYMRESEVEMHYRDMRIMGIGGGATEILTELAGKLLGYDA